MALGSGTKLGPYEILAPLGSGGMGEVYLAKDSRLGRDVALKILPESFRNQSDRLQRFMQEMRAVAALNHPNILAVFDVGEHQGSPFMVSELLEGETLRKAIDRGPLPQRKTIDYGVQIAQGLAAAHEKGIVHRDLKPENLFVTKDGHVKILDFGLAKLTPTAGLETTSAEGLTLTNLLTEAGSVMGTASYMAPEQVRGATADQRTDIFAFGAVAYEMLCGKRAFRGDTPAETMTEVLKADVPELSDPSLSVSPVLDRIVHRCLERDPAQRFQSAKDLSFALSALSGISSARETAMPPQAPSRLPATYWVSIAAVLHVAIAGLTWYLVDHPAKRHRMQFAMVFPGEVTHMALSPDGSTLVFVSPGVDSGLPMLYLQRIGTPSATLLPGTEGASYPFWAPDSTEVAFFANGKLEKTAVSGGVPQVLANVSTARGGSWGRKNVIVYSPSAGNSIWRVNADGTGAAPVTDLILAQSASTGRPEGTHRWPTFLPDGNHFLFWGGNFGNAKDDPSSGIYVSSLDGKERRLLVLCRSSFGYDSDHLYYGDDQRRLVSLPFDLSTATVSGSPTIVGNSVGFQPSTFWTALTVSARGPLVYNDSPAAVLSALTWMDRAGKELGKVGDPAVIFNPALSPDGSRVALDISDRAANNVDVWLESATGNYLSRFTFKPEEEVAGVWSHDGKTIAYRSNGATGTELCLKQATGLEQEKLLLKIPDTDELLPNSWSPDGRQILATHASTSGSRLELISIAGGTSTPFLTATASEEMTNGMISPDGKWVAYASNELGSWEIYVTTFPSAAGKLQVSRGGGTEPRWRSDGKEIFYIAPNGVLMAAQVDSGNSISIATPVPLFQLRRRAPNSTSDIFSYDVTRDGMRFLVNRYVKPEHVTILTVVLNAAAAQ